MTYLLSLIENRFSRGARYKDARLLCYMRFYTLQSTLRCIRDRYFRENDSFRRFEVL